ncbi:acyl carrier protein [Natronorubrum bangense]|uniref:Acyl carrier protein n=2 Tax=Natronorubrum bangense TaxID=61858 RepID=A0A4D6HQD6_9EURY|nr:acyl carrier protein [Natronorubrum bangense]ELY43582.1 acyl carrier protein [Natronorubrum bangense JCM 10635]QCC53174.1 acyl carrier protein [Natronorubrum bangense]QCC56133.1 acyl carrier protein [Natronorubrum bangense]
MSNATEIANQLEEIIADRLRVDRDAFDETTEFEDEPLDAESLDMVELAEAIEAEVGVHIPDDDLAEIETVGDLRTYVTARV